MEIVQNQDFVSRKNTRCYTVMLTINHSNLNVNIIYNKTHRDVNDLKNVDHLYYTEDQDHYTLNLHRKIDLAANFAEIVSKNKPAVLEIMKKYNPSGYTLQFPGYKDNEFSTNSIMINAFWNRELDDTSGTFNIMDNTISIFVDIMNNFNFMEKRLVWKRDTSYDFTSTIQFQLQDKMMSHEHIPNVILVDSTPKKQSQTIYCRFNRHIHAF